MKPNKLILMMMSRVLFFMLIVAASNQIIEKIMHLDSKALQEQAIQNVQYIDTLMHEIVD